MSLTPHLITLTIFISLSGLDPAGPYFTTVQTSFRLDESDAQYVDVIHTNAGVKGTIHASGHTDFWPNGGSIQPGCPLSDLTKSKHLQNRDNHNYSLEIFLIFLRIWEVLLIFIEHTLGYIHTF